MQLGLENLEIDTFTLTSSSQVADVVEELQTHNKHRLLIHIVSYIHNTVLVQTLKKELVKALPDARIVLLKHEDKPRSMERFRDFLQPFIVPTFCFNNLNGLLLNYLGLFFTVCFIVPCFLFLILLPAYLFS